MFESNVLLAFLLTIFAGLSTCIGSFFALMKKRVNNLYLSISLGFSAGVMLFVSFDEIFLESKKILVSMLGETKGILFATLSLFCGILISAIIDKLVPDIQNPHELSKTHGVFNGGQQREYKLMKLGVLSAIVIAVHNFPEGIATFVSAVNNPSVGIPIAFAIALHNIPEGVVVAVPIYYATGNKLKAFKYSFISGMAEPLGALLSYLLLMQFMNDIVFGIIFGMVAGIMIFISLDELLPTAQEYGEHHVAIWSLISGMMVMAFSLIWL